MLHSEYKLIFVHHEKTGGTSIAMALFNQDQGAKHSACDNSYDRGFTKHYSVDKALKVIGPEKWHEYTRFTVVRNPWDRLVSKWCWRREGALKRGCGVKDLQREHLQLDAQGRIPLKWFEREMVEECTRWNLSNPDDFLFGRSASQPQVDHALRFESLQSDWEQFAIRFGLPATALPHTNQSKERTADYRSYYTDTTAAFVASQFSRTITHFGYSF